MLNATSQLPYRRSGLICLFITLSADVSVATPCAILSYRRYQTGQSVGQHGGLCNIDSFISDIEVIQADTSSLVGQISTVWGHRGFYYCLTRQGRDLKIRFLFLFATITRILVKRVNNESTYGKLLICTSTVMTG